LGIDPETWAHRTGRVAMRLEDRLFDLVWQWSRHSTHVISCSFGSMAHVEREIARLSGKIFGKAYPPYTLEKLATNLYDEACLKAAGYPEEVHFRTRPGSSRRDFTDNPDRTHSKKHFDGNNDDEDLDLLRNYLKDPGIFKRGHEVEWFSVTSEIASLTALQNHLRQTVGSLGIVVEVNPSSNLLIGNVADLRSHPLWRLNSPLADGNVPPVAICIGSDDPLTFATRLKKEFALVYEALVDGGLSAQQAWDWVDMVRKTGMNSRFTLPVDEPRKGLSDAGCNFHNRYRVRDIQMPRSYWVLGLGKDIQVMP
jgi:hypothetical protein